MRLRSVTCFVLLLAFAILLSGCGEKISIEIQKATNGADSDAPPGTEVIIGEPIKWTYTIKNKGNVALSTIVVTDNMGIVPLYVSGDVNYDQILQVNETWIFEAEATAEAGQYANIGIVQGQYKGTTVQDTDASHYFGRERLPALWIICKTNGQDANFPTGPKIIIGETVTWTYEVTNIGEVDLTDILVEDDKGVVPIYHSGDDGDGILEISEIWLYSATGTAVLGQYSNMGYAEGWFEGQKVSDTDPSHYLGVLAPTIKIEKTTNGIDADEGPGPILFLGDVVTWTYTITNEGGVGLSGIYVDDDVEGEPSYVSGDDGDNVLEPSEEWVYTATGIVALGQYANLGSVEGWYNGIKHTNSDPSHYLGVQPPSIDIEKSTNGVDADTTQDSVQVYIGSDITWTYRVENTGGVPLSDIVVSDDQGETPVYKSGDNGDSVLQPAEVWVFEATGVAVAGQYSNIGTAEGWYEGVKYSDEDASNYFAEVEPVPTSWVYDFMTAGNGDAIKSNEWFYETVGSNPRGIETSLGFYMNQVEIAAPKIFTGDFVVHYDFYPKIVDGDYIYAISMGLADTLWPQYNTSRFFDFNMRRMCSPQDDNAEHSLTWGTPFDYDDRSGNPPGIVFNTTNRCTIVKEGRNMSVYMNGSFVMQRTLIDSNVPTIGYAPKVFGHNSWVESESNFYLRRIEVIYAAGQVVDYDWNQ